MNENLLPSVSTDQVLAFVEMARQGSLRGAADQLHLTEQGVRNRLLTLESRLGVELYHKHRGPRRGSPLTPEGKRFLSHAIAFLERAQELGELFSQEASSREIHVVATQYLILYVLIDVVRRFHEAYPLIRVRLTTRTEHEIEETLLDDPDIALGVAAPYETIAELEYHHLFSLDWSLITPKGHSLLRKKELHLFDLVEEPFIMFERGSTGRQHVMEAFQGMGLSPRIEMETTNTEIIVRMVENGLGISLVPLMPDGSVTRGHHLGIRRVCESIRPIHSGILTRRGDVFTPATQAFMEFLLPNNNHNSKSQTRNEGDH
jgi:DNA-binding transcriptional LysR family regulator